MLCNLFKDIVSDVFVMSAKSKFSRGSSSILFSSSWKALCQLKLVSIRRRLQAWRGKFFFFYLVLCALRERCAFKLVNVANCYRIVRKTGSYSLVAYPFLKSLLNLGQLFS